MIDQHDVVPERTEQQDHLAERLREAREYLGLSQEFVATHTGIPRAAISAIENGKRRVEAVELKALSAIYKYPVGYFLGGELEVPRSIQAIARAASDLTDHDREQVLRFAQFLRAYGRSEREHSDRSGPPE